MTDISKRKILVLYTGGTIGSEKNPDRNESFKPASLENLKRNIPELKSLPYNVDYKEFYPTGSPIDSADANVAIYNALSQEIGNSIHDYDGIVIAYGTDTMAPSAAYLSYLLEGLQKPVIFTGSMIPASEKDSDARKNLTDAINFAAKAGHEEGSPSVNEVVICFNGKIFRGVTAVKYDSENVNAFETPVNWSIPKIKPLAQISPDGTIEYNETEILRNSEAVEFKINQIKNNLDIIPLDISMMNEAILKSLREIIENSDAVLVYNSGNLRSDNPKFRFLNDIKKPHQSFFLLNSSVSNSSWIESQGITNFQQAMAKIRYVLSRTNEPEKIKELFQNNLRGEGEGEIRTEADILENNTDILEQKITQDYRESRK